MATINELKTELTSLDVEFSSSDNKATLKALLKKAKKKPQEEAETLVVEDSLKITKPKIKGKKLYQKPKPLAQVPLHLRNKAAREAHKGIQLQKKKQLVEDAKEFIENMEE